MKIICAGYGANKTIDLTSRIQKLYDNEEQRMFKANNDSWGDPDKGNDKALFIVWTDDNGKQFSAVASEIGNVNTITL